MLQIYGDAMIQIYSERRLRFCGHPELGHLGHPEKHEVPRQGKMKRFTAQKGSDPMRVCDLWQSADIPVTSDPLAECSAWPTMPKPSWRPIDLFSAQQGGVADCGSVPGVAFDPVGHWMVSWPTQIKSSKSYKSCKVDHFDHMEQHVFHTEFATCDKCDKQMRNMTNHDHMIPYIQSISI